MLAIPEPERPRRRRLSWPEPDDPAVTGRSLGYGVGDENRTCALSLGITAGSGPDCVLTCTNAIGISSAIRPSILVISRSWPPLLVRSGAPAILARPDNADWGQGGRRSPCRPPPPRAPGIPPRPAEGHSIRHPAGRSDAGTAPPDRAGVLDAPRSGGDCSGRRSCATSGGCPFRRVLLPLARLPSRAPSEWLLPGYVTRWCRLPGLAGARR
jgi:hypothetical protein